MKINGLFPALVTPFDRNMKVDYPSLKKLAARLLQEGAGGFYVCGSTGECFLLSDEERKKILETVLDEVGGRVPVIAHVGKIAAHEAAELARHAREAGADAISSVPPFYYKFSPEEISGYYKSLAKAAGLPMIIYSIPAFSGVSITAQSLGLLLKESGAEGLKYTSYDLFELEKIKRKYPDLKLFYGHDELFVNALPIGISGAIGSTFNVMLQRFMAVQEKFERGENQLAASLQGEINRIIETLIGVGVFPGIKYLLSLSGIPCGSCREPFAPLPKESKALLDEIADSVF